MSWPIWCGKCFGRIGTAISCGLIWASPVLNGIWRCCGECGGGHAVHRRRSDGGENTAKRACIGSDMETETEAGVPHRSGAVSYTHLAVRTASLHRLGSDGAVLLKIAQPTQKHNKNILFCLRAAVTVHSFKTACPHFVVNGLFHLFGLIRKISP